MISEKVKLILLVDDDPINNYLNVRLLDNLNLADEVKVCMNGKEAIEFLKEMNDDQNSAMPELILLDINMPVFDGFEFLSAFDELKNFGKEEIKVVILTTSSALSDLDKIQQFGYPIVNKPLTEDKMFNILKY